VAEATCISRPWGNHPEFDHGSGLYRRRTFRGGEQWSKRRMLQDLELSSSIWSRSTKAVSRGDGGQ